MPKKPRSKKAANHLPRAVSSIVDMEAGEHRYVFVEGVGECRAHFKEMDVQILERFQEERARDYTEFASRCEAFVQEVEKETQAQHWTFAELEELRGDLTKLTSWLRKIQQRDYFPWCA